MSFVNTVDVVGDEVLIDSIIDRSITEIRDNLSAAIGKHAFRRCAGLTTAAFHTAATIGDYAFRDCSSLTEIDFPQVTSISTYGFYGCSALTRADFPQVTSIGTFVFNTCSNLTALILRSETQATLGATSAFTSTPIASGTGYIYVPSALVDSYKAASNWKTYAAQIRAIEDYPEVCGS